VASGNEDPRRETQCYFGPFRELAGRSDVEHGEPYDSPFAEVYLATTPRANADERFYLEQISRSGGPVLELGCGAGRITLEVARRGYDIDAFDTSRPMRDALGSAARRLPGDAGHVGLYADDIRTCEWPRRYGTIVVSAVMLPAFAATAGRDWLRRLAWALAPGGRLCFDVQSPRPTPEQETVAQHVIQLGDATVHLLQGTRCLHDPLGHVVNLYAEDNVDGALRRVLACEFVPWLTDDAVVDLMASAQLRIAARRDYGDGLQMAPARAYAAVPESQP
jgi:SAM-dependent methyltransferase